MPALALARQAQAYLKEVNFERPRDGSGLRLREMIVDAYRADLTLTGNNRFEAEFGEDDFAAGLTRDWSLGYHRICRQDDALLCLSTPGTPLSWTLVTCYYSAFFAATELMRALGRMIVYLDSDDRERMTGQAAGTGTLEAGNYVATGTTVDRGLVRLSFQKTAERPHQAIWRIVGATTSHLDDSAAIHRFLHVIGCSRVDSRWPELQSTRHRWNYVSPELYGSLGDSQGKHLRQIVLDADALRAWSRKVKLQPTPENAAVAIGFVRMVLKETIDTLNPIFAG